MFTKEMKAKIVKDFGRNDKDVGSPEVQVALLSAHIADLTEHLKTHVKDNSSRRGLMTMVTQRRRHLEYLKKNDFERYSAVIKRLGLRH